eukprot:jgi/Botrbrau1/22389/Bobra.0801s0002.1
MLKDVPFGQVSGLLSSTTCPDIFKRGLQTRDRNKRGGGAEPIFLKHISHFSGDTCKHQSDTQLGFVLIVYFLSQTLLDCCDGTGFKLGA